VLSVYLDTSVGRVQGRAYLLSLRNGCQSLRADLQEAPRGPRKAFETAADRAERYVDEQLVPRHPGLALFASRELAYFFAVPLPERPAGEFAWGPEPLLVPLEAALDDHERVAVALVDDRRARLFTLFLGRVETSEAFESNVPGRQTTGEWGGMARTDYSRQRAAQGAQGFGRGPRGGGLATKRHARHREDAVLEHVRRTAHALTELLRRCPYDRLLLAGPEEALVILRNELPRPLRARLAGTLALPMAATDDEVRRVALDAAEAIERQEEVRLVDELVEAAATSRAVLGLEPTLAALHDRRVYHLFLADRFPAEGGACPRCGRLVAGPGPCPACGAATDPVLDLGERAVGQALEHGARVEVVSGEAAALLLAHGGLGGRTRF
jgi:peptide subunit release factor 1 (eRF1)